MIFQSREMIRRDDAGRLEFSGIEWHEAKVTIENAVEFSRVLSLAAGAGMITSGIIFLLMHTGGGYLLSLGTFCVIIFFQSKDAVYHIDGTPRALVFERTGEMVAPLGLSAYRRGVSRVNGHFSDIASIEAEKLKVPQGQPEPTYGYGVRLILKKGNVVHIAQHLLEDDASCLAVQLSYALATLKLEVANENGGVLSGTVLID